MFVESETTTDGSSEGPFGPIAHLRGNVECKNHITGNADSRVLYILSHLDRRIRIHLLNDTTDRMRAR